MKNNPKMYGQEYDSNVVKDIKALNDKIEKEEDKEKLLNLRLQRLYRGMELVSTPMSRNYRGYYPY